jgi:nitrite reductase/ring-hydroxylating ferredoxin subunit
VSGAPALPPRIARYERSVAGPLAGVWENVHDWEHLPCLHRASFRSVALLEQGEWGWRARVGIPPSPDPAPAAAGASGPEIVIELRRLPGEEAYAVTTQEGPGTGGVILTRLASRGPGRTHVAVDFHVPGVGDDAAPSLGRAYVALYTRLWDEDEGMIVRRAQVLLARPPRLGRPARLDLGPRAALALPMAFELAGRRFRLVESDGELRAHSTVCPHRLGPLEEAAVEDGTLRCPWHGYRFDLASGASCDGRGLRLARAPAVRVDPASGRVEAVLEPGP